MFIAVPIEVKENVQDVSRNHWQIQAIVVSTDDNRILLINSYFPTDPKTQDFDTRDLLCTLDTINDVINANQFDHLVWAGDLNADFSRHTQFTTLVDQFTDERSLIRAWDM